ncbi:MAG: glycosyltransferase family 2 protein [Candidatus Aureabacteria bacterium]|nr:glycosyltransferase family 2 protein [Candidatus Auribacterota bacterium]
MTTVTLFVPTLNEIEGMRVIMPLVKKEWVDQVLIVDGGSTDGTVEYAREQGYDVYVQKEKGLRKAYAEAWPLIKGDWVITFSPDGNSPPECIPALIDKMSEGYDMVIGSRYYGDATSEDDDILSGFGNWLFTHVINLLFKGGYTDAMTIYRIYRKDLFYELDLDKDVTYAFFEKIYFTRIGVEPILSTRFAKRRLRGVDIPCPEPPRIGGVRKLQVVRWGLAYMSQILREAVYWR